MFLATVVLVAALFLGSAASAGLKAVGTGETKQNNITSSISAIPSTTALAPHTAMPSIQPHSQTPRMDRGQFYAYDLYSYYTVTFETDAVLNNLAYAGIYFFSGGDMDLDGNWYVVGYYGGLYSIDKDTGIYTTIAPSTIYCDSLVFDTSTQTWYVSSGNMLYTMDITDGSTNLVGSFGTADYMISLMCDSAGNMYGYTVSFSQNTHLYSIDKGTGIATDLGSMGHVLCYAQEGKFDRNDDTLYLAAYDVGMGQSYLATVDPSNPANYNILALFSPMDEIDALAIPYELSQFAHDVGVKSIVAPVSGNAGTIIPEVTVKNFNKTNDEYSVPVTLTIYKNQYANYLNEHFDGTFPPAGWNAGASDYWVQNFGTNAGGTSPEAILWYWNDYGGTGTLTSPYVDTSAETGTLLLSFRSYIYLWTSGLLANVEVTPDGGTNWYNLNGQGNIWSNPVTSSQGPKLYTVDISAYKGTQTGVRFAYSGLYYWMYYWAIDDVRMFSEVQLTDYPATTVYANVPHDTIVDVTFPAWTPTDMGVSENVNLEYVVNATTQMSYDENTHNDYKQKTFDLAYGYFHNVAITAVNSPESGLAEIQPVNVTLENHGQNDESVNVNVQIGLKTVTGTTEDFETSDGGYTHTDFTMYTPSDIWAWGQPTSGPGSAHSGTNCWATVLGGNYPDGMDARLETQNFVVPSNAELSFWQWYEFESYWDGGNVKISNDDGATWAIIYPVGGYPQIGTSTANYGIPGEDAYSPTSGGWVKASFDLQAYTGQTVKLRFHAGSDGSVNYAGWYIDDVTIAAIGSVLEYDHTVTVDIAAGASMFVTGLPDWKPLDVPLGYTEEYLVTATATLNGFTELGCYGFEDYVPPAGGWTISPAGSWQQYNYYTPGYATPCAELPYNYAPDWTDDTFTSPPVDTTGYGTLTLSYASYISWYYDSDTYFYVEVTADGVNWYDVTPWSNPCTGNIGPSWYSADISAYISTQTQVRFRFYGYAYDFNYWYIDDVSFGPYYTDFSGAFPPAGSPGYLPGWTEQVIVGSGPQFFTVGTVNTQYPWCTPHSGDYMEEYNSYSLPTGDQALLIYNTPLDLASMGYSSYILTFWMFWYYGYDYLNVEASTDGINWVTLAVFYDTYDPIHSNVWTQQSVDLSAYAGESTVYLAFSGYSSWWYNMFFDDICILGAGEIPDGYPADNTLSEVITLSYEHDVGVVTITEPSYNPMKLDDVIFHQGYWSPDESWAFDTSGMALNYLCYDDFYGLTDSFGSITVTGLSLANNGGWIETSPNLVFDVTFYEDNAGQPGAVIQTITGLVPTSIVDTGLDYIGFSQYVWTIDLGTTISLTSGWMSVQSEIPADNGNLMWATGPDGTLNAYQLQSGVLVALGQNMCFDLIKAAPPPGGDWPPGTYHVAGIVKNIGVTFSEINIPVEAIITHTDNSTVIYDETTTVAGPLAPGETALVTFPDDFTLYNSSTWEGAYKVEIKTLLPGDDHSNNDKKTMTFKMGIVDVLPPITNHTITGTFGNNGWYVSNVVITLTAYDPAPPLKADPKPASGVNHTYYKLHAADNWTEYTGPVTVSTDGNYELSYYSVDKGTPGHPFNTETVKGPFAFKMDKTAPTIVLTVLALNAMKNKWLLNATVADATSGVFKVEFYVDDVLEGNDTVGPYYTFEYKGKGKVAQAIVYDNAGNSAMSLQVNEYIPDYNSQQSQQLLNQNMQTPSFQQILLQK